MKRNSCWENRLLISFNDKKKFHFIDPKESDDPFELMTCTGTRCIVSTLTGRVYSIEERRNTPIKFLEVPALENFTKDQSKIKFLIAGYYHFIVIKESNSIYASVEGSCIKNEYGTVEEPSTQKSINESLVKVKTCHFIKEGSEITHAACGTNCTVVVVDNRYVYVSGKILNSYSDFTKISINETDPIVKSISIGYDHLIIGTIDGSFYGLGGNEYHQLYAFYPFSEFKKFTFANQVLSLKALRLSHLTCQVSQNRLDVHGYFGMVLEYYEREGEYHVYEKVNGSDIEAYGGFTTMVVFNKRKKKLLACGSNDNAPAVPYDILQTVKDQSPELVQYIDNHTVLDVQCGSNIISVLMGEPPKYYLLSINLFKMFQYSIHQIEHSSGNVPFFDILIQTI